MSTIANQENNPTRESILKLALETFASQGFEGVSVRSLNRELGGSHNLIHHYFGSKDGLWREAIDYGIARIARAWELAPENASDDPAEILRKELLRFVKSTAADPSIQLILEREAVVGGPRLNYIVDRYIAPAFMHSTPYFEQVINISGRRLELRGLVLLVASGATAFFTQSALTRKLSESVGGADPFSESAIEQHCHSVVDVLLYGLLGKPPENDNKNSNLGELQ